DSAELAYAGLRRQADMLAGGETSSAALLEGVLARIERLQPVLGAFRIVCSETARAEAAEADRRLAAGERLPLLGVPVAIKDDVGLLLDVLAGNRDGDRHRPAAPHEPFADAARRPPERLRVALSFTTPFGTSSKVDSEVRSAVLRTADRLRDLGHDVFAADPD